MDVISSELLKELLGQTTKVRCDAWVFNCVVQSLAHPPQDVMKILWQCEVKPVALPSMAICKK